MVHFEEKKGPLRRWIAVVKSLSFLCTSHIETDPQFLSSLKVVIHCVSLNYGSAVAKFPIRHYPLSITCHCILHIVIQVQQDSKTQLPYVRGILLKTNVFKKAKY